MELAPRDDGGASSNHTKTTLFRQDSLSSSSMYNGKGLTAVLLTWMNTGGSVAVAARDDTDEQDDDGIKDITRAYIYIFLAGTRAGSLVGWLASKRRLFFLEIFPKDTARCDDMMTHQNNTRCFTSIPTNNNKAITCHISI